MFDSSPIASGSRVGSDMGASSRRRVVYSKEFDEQMDRLTKQNFALKLELDHRRGNTTKLQEQIEEMRAQVERAEQLEDEHAELLRINTQLVEELEKRDKAVEEAMDIICELEDKVTDLEERNSNTRPSTANADSGYAGTETQEQAPPSSPPELSRVPKTPAVSQRQPPPAASAAAGRLINAMNGKTPGRLRREPSVMSQKKSSTHALRSVYQENAQSLHPVKSFRSLLSKQESAIEDEDGEPVLNSPRLSVLSESSFPSLYSPKTGFSPDRYSWEDGEEEHPESISSHLRQDSIKRVSQWMDERDGQDDTPSKSNKLSSPSKLAQQLERDLSVSPSKRPGDDERYQSLADALSTASTAAPNSTHEVLQLKSYSSKPRSRPQQLKTEPRPTSFAGPIFGSPLLPPTPDSASTRMLRNSHSSIAADDRSLLDNTPAPIKSYAALQPDPALRTAPKQMRSSIELKTAYQSYVQREHDEALSSDEEDEEHAGFDHFAKNLKVNAHDFPDGNSILFGTPSRFLKGPKQTPQAGNSAMFDGNDLSPPPNDRLQRRQSSSDATISPRKPSLSRAETSPTFLGPIATSLSQGAHTASNGSVTSPRSYHSGSSSNRTVVTHQDDRAQQHAALLPTFSPPNMSSPPRTRKSPSPARTLSQKTQRLFRRMSNSTKDRDTATQASTSVRDPSPLPTLTSTPSSAYVNTIPKEARRPSSSAGGDIVRPVVHAQQRPSTSSRTSTATTTTAAAIVSGAGRSQSSDRRPSLQSRTKTEPASAYDAGRRTSAAGSEGTPVGQRINPFKRSNSVKTPGHGLGPANAEKEAAASMSASAGGKGAARRRGSIRDAVGRRGWR